MTYQVKIFEPYVDIKPKADAGDVILTEWELGCHVIKQRLLSGFRATKKRTTEDYYEFLVEGKKVRVNKAYCQVKKIEDDESESETKPKTKIKGRK